MNKFFFARLAATNLRKNGKVYFPYILTGIGSVMAFYILGALTFNSGMQDLRGGAAVQSMMQFGLVVVGLFSVVFLFYTNSFLVRRRKREFGLFNILGMEKRHIFRVVFMETVYTALISIVAGLLLGILLYKLAFLALLQLLRFDVQLGFELAPRAIVITVVLFGAIYLLTMLSNIRQIHTANPIALLNSDKAGEKEPKTKWPLAILGAVSLGAGYYLAVTTKDPITAMGMFFLAVLLVILGTYCLFTAGSIALLKALRRRKKFYYQPNHFITVSGMLYRMKRNAVGLANICILSTMVLVTLSTTVSLYIGTEDMILARYPRQIDLIMPELDPEQAAAQDAVAQSVLQEHGLTMQNEVDYRYSELTLYRQADGTFSAEETGTMDIVTVTAVPLEDFPGAPVDSLAEGEALLYVLSGAYEADTMTVLGQTFHIRDRLTQFPGEYFSGEPITDVYYLVVPDLAALETLNAAAQTVDITASLQRYHGFDLDAGDDVCLTVYEEIRAALREQEISGGVSCRADGKEDFYALHGGFFFLGIVLGLLFLMATVLIIYYKQISEGYEDKSRYEIMQKVGMSHAEVRRSIRSQVLTVFFLPLVVAGVHIAFAFGIIVKLLQLFSLSNVTLFACCTAGTILVFAALYAVVYALTARTYYKIVR